MNFLAFINERVYIRISDSYNDNIFNQNNPSLDIEDLICEVAKANPSGENKPLYDEKNDKVFWGRTKSFIVQKTENFITGLLEEEQQSENMATFASKRQLENLIRSFHTPKKNISCYGLIYLYIIYTLLNAESEKAKLCKQYISILNKVVLDYLEDNQNDPIASFFHGCYMPIINAINSENRSLDNKELPPRPRKHPKNFNEEAANKSKLIHESQQTPA